MDYVTRAEWGAALPKQPPSPMPGPVGEVYVHHADTPQGPDFAAIVRGIQAFHQGPQRGWSDIGYSWLVASDGTVFEGRGWNVVGAHTENHNRTGYGVCAIGKYDVIQPSLALLSGIATVVRDGVARGFIRPNPLIEGHRDANPGTTSCPGNALEALLPRIRALAAPAPPVPPVVVATPPPPAPVHDVQEDGMAWRTTLLPVGPLDSAGNGWNQWDPAVAGRDPIIFGPVLNGPYPPVDGYWYTGRGLVIAAQARAGTVIVSVVGGTPGDTVNVRVTVT